MTRILIGYDGSEHADRAVGLVAAMPWSADTVIRVVSVVPSAAAIRSAWGRLIVGDPGSLEDELATIADGALAAPRGRLTGAELRAEAGVLRGRPAQSLADEAQAWRSDLLVVGSRGLGPAKAGLLGSVSAEVIDGAPCPVLVARSTGVRAIVLATDGSPCAGESERILASLAIAQAVPVTVVSVAHAIRIWTTGIAPMLAGPALQAQVEQEGEARAAHAAFAEAAADRLRAGGSRATADVRVGDPPTEIIAAAEATGADLIVLGSRGRTGLRRIVLGSVARNVLHRAEASVLVVRSGTTGCSSDGPSTAAAEEPNPSPAERPAEA